MPDGPLIGVSRTSLAGLDRAELADCLEAAGVPAAALRMRTAQLWNWIYQRGATRFDAMTDVARPLRETLAERYDLERPAIAAHQRSRDGTRKWLLRLDDGREVETVYIPEEDRGALCLSSQVGCTLSCSFCYTGTQRLVRNLGGAGDRGPVPGGAGRLRRVARPAHARRRAGAPDALQHRDDGYGRAALQLRERREGAAHRDGPGGPRAVPPADHASPLQASCR